MTGLNPTPSKTFFKVLFILVKSNSMKLDCIHNFEKYTLENRGKAILDRLISSIRHLVRPIIPLTELVIKTSTNVNCKIALWISLISIPNSYSLALGQNLTYLNLAHNNISELPDLLFGQCISLQKLNLTGNKISELPNGIGNLNKLNWLNLSFNQIEALPPR